MTGPLVGVRIVEFEAIGPVPMAGMILADMGADVVRVTRPSASAGASGGSLDRGRTIIAADLKNECDRDAVGAIVARADILIEGFRPGVMERLGLGADACLASNPALVFGRMTGWGQTGPLAERAGHDINYIALTGALHAIGKAGQPPTVPLNLIGDYGGGAMFLIAGVLAALTCARTTGRGQVVDVAMTEGTATLLTMFRDFLAHEQWHDRREANLLDGHAPFYRCYACADGGYVAVGCLEPRFFAEFVTGLGLEVTSFQQYDETSWHQMHDRFAAVLRTRTRDEWATLFATTDACVTPVLSLTEACHHPHAVARGGYLIDEGAAAPAPAPKFEPDAGAARPRKTSDLTGIAERWAAR